MRPHLVSVPVGRLPSPDVAADWGQVALRLRDEASVEALRSWRALVPVRRVRVPLAGNPEGLLSRLGTGLRLDCEVTADTADRLAHVAPSQWITRGVNPWAVLPRGAGGSAHEVVRGAGAAGWPFQLEPTPELLQGALPLLEILDHYLFHPTLTAPVEPFHGLLVGLVRKRPAALWHHWFGVPVDHYHVDEAGQVSLCGAWADRDDRRYGTDAEPVAHWRASGAHGALRDLRARADRVQEPCHGCAAARLCGGVLLALDDDADCETWREVLERLRLAAVSLQRRPGQRPSRV